MRARDRYLALSVLRSSAVAICDFPNDFDPQVEREILAFRPPELIPHLGFVTRPQHVRIEYRLERQTPYILAISIDVARQLRQDEVVRLEPLSRRYLKIPLAKSTSRSSYLSGTAATVTMSAYT
jgi:hypothetical protein